MIFRNDKAKRKLNEESRVVSGIGLRNPRSNSSDRLPSFQDSRFSNSRPSSIFRNSEVGAAMFAHRNTDFQEITHLRNSRNFEESKAIDLPIQEQISNLFEKYSDRGYIISMISYHQKKWQEDSERYLRGQKYNSLARLLMQRTAQFNPLLQDFLTLDYSIFSEPERKLLVSMHYKQYQKLTHDLQSVTRSLLSKVPDEKLIRQETEMFELFKTLLRMYDVKNNNSQEKMKEGLMLFGETYSRRKSELLASVSQKHRPMTDVLLEVEKYFTIYQRDISRLQNSGKNLERQLEKTKQLLEQKPLFTPIEVDYVKIKEIRDSQKKEIFQDFEGNIVKYYGHRVQHFQDLLKMNEQRISVLEAEIRTKDETISDLKVEINRLINEKPVMVDAETQLFYVASKKSLDSISQGTGNGIETFLENVNTPFQFSRNSTSCIINLFLVDKVLYDYELIRNKAELKPFRLFLYEWFVLKSGSKKVAQILCKNFVLSLAEMRRDNKRYHLFSKLAGLLKPRGKNLLEDLDMLFHQTQLAWYYYLKIALAYRRKLIENPSGFPMVPPTSSEQITRLSLRKTYELIDQFFQNQGLQKPEDLHSKIDLYSINEISRFKMHDERFQKQQLQEIHILREITFDIICGFLMEHTSTQKCSVVEKFLRALQVRHRDKKSPLTYADFEVIYKRFYRDKRSKIELVFARFCLGNHNNVLDVESSRSLIVMLIEDQTKIRTVFEKIDSLKLLIFSEKAAIKWMEKRTSHPNSFENFRDRYFLDFFDFYHSTSFLADLYHSVKPLIRKCIMKESGRQRDLQIDDSEVARTEQKPGEKREQDSPQRKDQQEQDRQHQQKQDDLLQQDLSLLQRKVQQFKTIFAKVPKFAKRIITVDQLMIHNMRRKDCIDATEYTWKVLRQILMILSDRSDLL